MLVSVRRVGRTNKEHQVKGEDHLLQSLTTLICESKQAKKSLLCRSLGRAAVEQLSLLSGGDGQTASLADGSGECYVCPATLLQSPNSYICEDQLVFLAQCCVGWPRLYVPATYEADPGGSRLSWVTQTLFQKRDSRHMMWCS